MNRLRIVLGIVLITAAGCKTVPGRGKIEVMGGPVHDWGTVKPGKLTTTFKIRNSGDGDLKITGVNPSCGCTLAPIDKKDLKPGDTASIAVTLDVMQKNGPVEKTITVTSTDSLYPNLTLNLKANIKRALTMEPMGYIMVVDARAGHEKASDPMHINNTGDQPVTIYRPEMIPGANFSARFGLADSVVLQPGQNYEFRAYVTPNDTITQSFSGVFTLRTSSPEAPLTNISITGAVIP